MSGPLAGLRIIELSGIGPGPFAAMLLADLGAEVIRIDRPTDRTSATDTMLRNRSSIVVDLATSDGAEVVLALVADADALIEGMRPGVAERLGVGPEACHARNPGLVYGRMTGWGQEGPLAHAAGHDINYVGITGALHAIGPRGGAPVPPLALLGDLGGGGLYLALGILAALHERSTSGLGQVIDAAIVDGVGSMMTPVYGAFAAGIWRDERGTNAVDGGAPFYRTYPTADDRWVSVGPLEQRFFEQLCEQLGVAIDPIERWDPTRWDDHEAALAEVFRSRTQAEWCELLEGTDVCFGPVLDLHHAPDHPHHVARGSFVDVAGVTQPAPAPRFDRTPAAVPRPPAAPGADTVALLREAGFDDTEIERLITDRIVTTQEQP